MEEGRGRKDSVVICTYYDWVTAEKQKKSSLRMANKHKKILNCIANHKKY